MGSAVPLLPPLLCSLFLSHPILLSHPLLFFLPLFFSSSITWRLILTRCHSLPLSLCPSPSLLVPSSLSFPTYYHYSLPLSPQFPSSSSFIPRARMSACPSVRFHKIRFLGNTEMKEHVCPTVVMTASRCQLGEAPQIKLKLLLLLFLPFSSFPLFLLCPSLLSL